MKKFFFFAAAIAAVAFVSCSNDEDGTGSDDSCTCTMVINGITTEAQSYDSSYMDYLNVSTCSELESYFEDELYEGAYEVTCK